MPNSQKGFVVPIIIAIVAVLAVGGGAFVYQKNKVEAPEIKPIDRSFNISVPVNIPTAPNIPKVDVKYDVPVVIPPPIPSLPGPIDLKTYVDDKYKFEVDYPSTWFTGRNLGDLYKTPREGDVIGNFDFSSHSLGELEFRRSQGLSSFPDGYKNIHLSILYSEPDSNLSSETYNKNNIRKGNYVYQFSDNSTSGQLWQETIDMIESLIPIK